MVIKKLSYVKLFLAFKFFTKTKAFGIIKLFLQKNFYFIYLKFIILLEGNLPREMYIYGKMPINNVSCIFEFWLVPFAFSLILRDTFMVSLPTLHPKEMERGFFQKNTFQRREILREKFVEELFYMEEH